MKKLLFIILTLIAFTFFSAAQEMQNKQGKDPSSAIKDLSTKKNLSSGDLIGSEVYKDNSKIGEIKDVVIGKDGNVKDVVVSMGGVFGMGEKYYLVPWNKIKFNQNRIESQMSKNEIEATPSRTSLENIDEWSASSSASPSESSSSNY